MLLTSFLSHFGQQAPERYRTLGASSAGYCARRLAYSHWPELYEPEPMSPRRRARLRVGSIVEEHFVGVLKKMLPATVEGATVFLWPVECSIKVIEAAMSKIDEKRIVGHVLKDFDPDDVARYRRACADLGLTRVGGIVVDPVTCTVFLPALPDGIADLPDLGLATVEFKTISTAGFRHVLTGDVDYGYRTQFAIEADAARVQTHVALFYRLETSHGLEIVYSRKVHDVRVTVTLTNGQRRLLRGEAHGVQQVTGDGSADAAATHGVVPGLPGDATGAARSRDVDEPSARGRQDALAADEWDTVEIQTPFDAQLLEQARKRVRRVLGSTTRSLPEREYGPSFVCPKCKGDGEVVCQYCDGTGISNRSKRGALCKPCRVGFDGSFGKLTCKCGGTGTVEETELPFPCSYCAFKRSCWDRGDGTTLYALSVDERPHYRITQKDYMASGMSFTPPEGI